MRIYLHPALNRLISTTLAIAAIGFAGFLGFKAWEIWSTDPSLNQLPGIMDEAPAQ